MEFEQDFTIDDILKNKISEPIIDNADEYTIMSRGAKRVAN
jgi:hypothetical protein